MTQSDTTSANSAGKPLPRYWTILAGNLLGGASLFWLDKMVLGTGALAILILAFAVLVLLPMAVRSNKNIPSLRLQRWTRFSIYFIVAVGAWGRDKYEIRQEHTNFERLVVAVHQYQEKERQYPEKLEQLVPQYLRSVPDARYGTFYYWGGEDPRLMHTVIPPFARESYHFRTREWNTID